MMCAALASCAPASKTKQPPADSAPQTEQPSATPAPQTERPTGGEQPSDAPEAGLKVKITFMTQEYDGDNVVEIPYFEYDGAKSETPDSINRAYNQGLQRWYADFTESAAEGEFVEIRSYPFTSRDYLQVVTTYCAFPTYGTDGDLISVNYDAVNDKWISLSDAMESAGLDNETMSQNAGRLFKPEFDGQVLKGVGATGFLIHDGGAAGKYIRFLLEITTANEGGDIWKAFYSYTPALDELYRMNSQCLFDPAEPDQMEPPLAYQRMESGGAQPAG
jgi:hypothetical protein